MSIEDRLNKFKELGWTYDPVNGTIYSHMNKPVKNRICRIINGEYKIQILKHTLAWFLMTGEVKYPIYHKDTNNDNFKWSNLTLINPYLSKTENKSKYKQFKRANYLNDVELTYEIIISQAQGKLTKKAETMLIRMSDEVIRKFSYRDKDDEYDCKMNGLYMMFIGWNGFNHKKFDNCFPYFTEICKRGITKGFNELISKNSNIDFIPTLISLSSLYNK